MECIFVCMATVEVYCCRQWQKYERSEVLGLKAPSMRPHMRPQYLSDSHLLARANTALELAFAARADVSAETTETLLLSNEGSSCNQHSQLDH